MPETSLADWLLPEKYVYFFWVSGDSFELFRDMRGSLWDRNYDV